jgi:purine catabolism regulator
MILQFADGNEADPNDVIDFVNTCQASLQGDYSISFGVSNTVHSIKDITTAYAEACEAIMSGYDMNMLGFINFYKMKELEDLLNTIPKKDLKALYENTLKSLAYPKTKENQELIKTIQVYLDSQCEISETSRRLYIHRNTVKYRIEKAEEILNCSFRDPAHSLRIRVALLIGSILKEEK